MNKTKRVLIILSIIFNFISVAYSIYSLVIWFTLAPAIRSGIVYLVFDFIDIFAMIAVAVLLILSIAKGGKLFRARHQYYMIAIVISIIMNLFSLETLFLVITMFLSDWQWIKPEDDKVYMGDNVEVITKTKEQKIAELRAKRESGELSEEEFQKELVNLI